MASTTTPANANLDSQDQTARTESRLVTRGLAPMEELVLTAMVNTPVTVPQAGQGASVSRSLTGAEILRAKMELDVHSGVGVITATVWIVGLEKCAT